MEYVSLLGCLSNPEFYSENILITELRVNTKGKCTFENYSKSRDSTIMNMIKKCYRIFNESTFSSACMLQMTTLQGNAKILSPVAHFEDI